jgi:hypothetical protein
VAVFLAIHADEDQKLGAYREDMGYDGVVREGRKMRGGSSPSGSMAGAWVAVNRQRQRTSTGEMARGLMYRGDGEEHRRRR